MIGTRVASGLQPSRRALPQLVPDGLTSQEHLSVALSLEHPAVRQPSLFPPVDHAFEHQAKNPEEVVAQRESMINLLCSLSTACAHEATVLRDLAPEPTQRVLVAGGPTRNIPFMREIAYVVSSPDYAALGDYCIGLQMLGWAQPAPGMLARTVYPMSTINTLLETSQPRNERIHRRVKASDDAELDARAWDKTKEEIQLGLVSSPCYSFSDLPWPSFALVRRRGIWEQRACADEPSVRVLDDLLEGGQNDTVGYQYTHRPADIDAFSACARVAGEAFAVELSMFTSDFAKALRQVRQICINFCVVPCWRSGIRKGRRLRTWSRARRCSVEDRRH